MEFLQVLAVEEGANSGITAGLDKFKHTDGLKGLGMEELGHTVSGAGDEHGMVISHSEGEDLALVHISLHHTLIFDPIMNEESALIGSNVHSLVEGSPRSLSDDMVLRSSNLLLTLGVFVCQGLLEVVHADV